MQRDPLDVTLREFLEKLLASGAPEIGWVNVKDPRWALPWKQIALAGRRGELQVSVLGRRALMVRREALDRWLGSKADLQRAKAVKAADEKLDPVELMLKNAGWRKKANSR